MRTKCKRTPAGTQFIAPQIVAPLSEMMTPTKEWGFPGGSVVKKKKSACSAVDLGSVPGLGRSPAGGNGNPLQSSCLENSMYRGAWWATVHRVSKSQKGLSD